MRCRSIRAEVTARALAKGLLAESRARTESVPEIGDGCVIVAYGIIIGPDGVPSQYVGTLNPLGAEYVGVCIEQEVAASHQSAREWYQKSLGVGIQVTQQYPWVHYESGFRTWREPPYGVLRHNYRLYRLSETHGTRDNFGIHETFAMQPGIAVENWDSDFRNYEGWAEQNWDWGVVEEDLYDWAPRGILRGAMISEDVRIKPLPPVPPIAVAIAASLIAGALLEWAFDDPGPDLTITAHACLAHVRARWHLEFRQGTTRSKITTRVDPGSSIQAFHQPSGWHPVLHLRASATYVDPCPWWFDRLVTLRHNWRITARYPWSAP